MEYRGRSADIWSAGATLVEMFMGRIPAEKSHETNWDAFRRKTQMTEPPAPPAGQNLRVVSLSDI